MSGYSLGSKTIHPWIRNVSSHFLSGLLPTLLALAWPDFQKMSCWMAASLPNLPSQVITANRLKGPHAWAVASLKATS